jgi:osmotically-inducible protein OsmY
MHTSDEQEDTDRRIRFALLAQMKEQDWTDFGDRNVIVRDGIIHLWGLVSNADERAALIAVAGVVRVADEMIAAYR